MILLQFNEALSALLKIKSLTAIFIYLACVYEITFCRSPSSPGNFYQHEMTGKACLAHLISTNVVSDYFLTQKNHRYAKEIVFWQNRQVCLSYCGPFRTNDFAYIIKSPRSAAYFQ
jgi:hypothetical protein